MTTSKPILKSIEITGEVTPEFAEILTPEAMSFVATLVRAFRDRREELLVKGRVIGLHIGENGRFEEEPTPIELLSAKQHFRAAFNRGVDLLQDTVKSSLSAERS